MPHNIYPSPMKNPVSGLTCKAHCGVENPRHAVGHVSGFRLALHLADQPINPGSSLATGIDASKHPILVLDTNVCLDLFVFHDPRWALIRKGLAKKKLTAITKKSCRDEWLAVLHYRQLPVTDDSRPEIILAFDNLIDYTEPELQSHIKLPLCSDKDDQQFLELARDGGATHLITKDKALLKCAKKCVNLNLFNIVSPESFIQSIQPLG